MTPPPPDNADDNDPDDTSADAGMDAVVIRRLRDALQAPAPVPSAELAAFLTAPTPPLQAATTLPVEPTDTAAHPRSRTAGRGAAAWFVGLGLAAQIGVGSAAAATGVALAGAADRLPDPAQRVFDAVVEVLRPDTETANQSSEDKQAPGEDIEPTPVAEIITTDDPDTSKTRAKPRKGDDKTQTTGDQSDPALDANTPTPGNTATTPSPSPPPSQPDQPSHPQNHTGGPGAPPSGDDDHDDDSYGDDDSHDDDAGDDDDVDIPDDGDGPSDDDEDADEDDEDDEDDEAFLDDPIDQNDEE